MADNAERRGQGAAGAAAPAQGKDGGAEKAKGGGGLLTKVPVLVGGAMVIEAVVFFGGYFVFHRGPQPAAAGEIAVDAGDGKNGKPVDKNKTAEVPVVEFKALNRANGRTFLYDVSIVAVVKATDEEHIKGLFKEKQALIEDRIRTIIAESDPEKLDGAAEPGNETLKRQVKFQLGQIVGDGVVDEVLVPRCLPFRTDY